MSAAAYALRCVGDCRSVGLDVDGNRSENASARAPHARTDKSKTMLLCPPPKMGGGVIEILCMIIIIIIIIIVVVIIINLYV